MITPALSHDTIRLERAYSHPPSALFAAYADIERRVVWSAPSENEVVVFDSHDFRIGGTDEFRCGLKGQMFFAGTTRYEQIVTDELIVYTERLVATDATLQAMSLVTWSIGLHDGGSRLTIVDQITSVHGHEPIEGSRAGYSAMLEQLANYLDDHS